MRKSLEERFWEKVTKTATCWVWGGKQREGYGRFTVGGNGRDKQAHRVAFELLVGQIPEGLTLDHLCRNRLCVNPKHLEPVTNKENILRGTGPSAHNSRKTTCPQGHQYDYAVAKGTHGTSRRCRTCDKRTAQRLRDSYRSQPRQSNPTKERLQQLLTAGSSWVDIGRRFGVSDVAARKWAKKYGLVHARQA